MSLAVEERRCPTRARLRSPALRRLLLLVASLALLGAGSLEVLLRPAVLPAALSLAPGAAGTVVGGRSGSPAGTERQAPHGAPVVRAAPATAMSGPLASFDRGPLPDSGRLLAPQPIAPPRFRALTTAPATRSSGAPGSRAPPAAAGTDASLPLRP
ncbi:MAG: hypothetical protein ACR2K2_06465 [Mycobacteriales bacterium]